MTIAEVGTAIGAYEYQTFDSRDSPWDRFVAGDDNAHYHNPKQSLKQYDITQLELPALYSTQLDTVKAVIANGIDPLLDDVKVNNGHIDDLVAFMTTLTDDSARDLHDVIPATVPSGIPVDH